jgi:serine/threonine protein kinase
VLFSKDLSVVKLCDFGVSNRVEMTRQTKSANAGTLRYMPPEQVDE